SKKEDISLEQHVVLDKSNITLKIGQQVVLQADFGAGAVPRRKYQWISSNQAVATAEKQESLRRATVTAKSEGTTTVSIRSEDGQLSASCEIRVTNEQIEEPDDDAVVRVLAIGNSFSDDALEHYLYGLAKAGGKSVVIGNLYIGGSSLSQHWTNASNNNANYSYRKINVEGEKT